MSTYKLQRTEAIAAAKALDERTVLIRGIEDNPDPKFALVRLAGFGLRVTYLNPDGVTSTCEGELIAADWKGITIGLYEKNREEHQDEGTGERLITWENLGLVEIF